MGKQDTKTAKDLADRLKGLENAPGQSPAPEPQPGDDVVATTEELSKQVDDLIAMNKEKDLIIEELNSDKEALTSQLDDSNTALAQANARLASMSLEPVLSESRVIDADDIEDVELKDSALYIQGHGTVKREDIKKEHVVTLIKNGELAGWAPEQVLTTYFKVKTKK